MCNYSPIECHGLLEVLWSGLSNSFFYLLSAVGKIVPRGHPASPGAGNDLITTFCSILSVLVYQHCISGVVWYIEKGMRQMKNTKFVQELE